MLKYMEHKIIRESYCGNCGNVIRTDPDSPAPHHCNRCSDEPGWIEEDK